MDEGSSLRYAEYEVSRRSEGKNRLARWLLLLFYIAFGGAYCVFFTVLIKLPQVIAILPLLLWILVYFTQRLVRYDIQVRVESGNFSVYKSAGKKRRLVFSARIKTALSDGPAVKHAALSGTKDFRGSARSPEGWFLQFPEGVILFEATAALVKALHFYNSALEGDLSGLRY